MPDDDTGAVAQALSTDPASGARPPLDAARFLRRVCLAVVLGRATYVLQPLRHDEGGYLYIARRWHSGGEFLYGDHFVDRPPLVMLVFRLAAVSDWDGAIRVLAIPFALLFVLSAWQAGTLLAGSAGGRWSAAVAGGLVCSPAIAADQADGELFAAALVMASIAATLTACRSPSRSRQVWLAGLAGLLAAGGPLVKQNMLEGLVFVAVLVTAAGWTRRRSGARCGAVAAGALLGASTAAALTWLWARSAGVVPLDAWDELAVFRAAALEIIWSQSPQATLRRLRGMLLLGLLSGVFAVVLTWLVAARRAPTSRSPEHLAITALAVYGIVSIAAGGSYWPNYLMQLAPVVALAVAVLAPCTSSTGRWMRVSSRTVVGSAVLATLVAPVVYATVPWVSAHRLTGEWLGASSRAGDTAIVAYGNPSILEAADVGTPYPLLWSVPMRALDPQQERLRATVAGPDAPVWIIEVDSLNSWRIDAQGRLRELVRDRYRVVATICDYPVWLRRDAVREPAPAPRCP